MVSNAKDSPLNYVDQKLVEKMVHNEGLFAVERDRILYKTTAGVLLFAMIFGAYAATVDLRMLFHQTFGVDQIQSGVVTLADPVDIRKPKVVEEKPVAKSPRRKIKESASSSSGRKNSGGDPRSRVSQTGILKILSSGATSGHVSADIFSKNGTATGIDKILRGVQSVTTGTGGPTRMGTKSFTGDGLGSVSGFGGDNASAVDALMGDLMGGGGSTLEFTKRKKVKLDQPGGATSQAIVGKRSRSEIMRVVQSNMQALRYIYNRHIRNSPNMKGKVTVKWAVDEFGNVIFCKVMSSSIESAEFKRDIVKAIKRWKFRKITVTGDVTEVVYPFVFTQ